MNTDGRLFIVSAPSGGGKTSLINALLEKHQGIKVSISYTTRLKRPGEINGVHYHFISEAVFQEKLARHEFLEDATVFGNHYGTCRKAVLERLKAGVDVVLEIDWQGAEQIRSRFPETCSIFILPPSLDILRARLLARAQDSPETVERRLRGAITEMAHYVDYDHILINDQFGETLSALEAIIYGGSLEFQRELQNERYRELLAGLLG